MSKVYQKRRHILGNLLPMDCAIIIPGADLKYRNADSSYNFRQDSNFYYLSGFCEADSTMLIVNTNGVITSSVFVPRKDKLIELDNKLLNNLNKNINLVIDYSNEDHCGTCSRHTIVQYHNPDTKIYETNKSNDNKSNDNELFSYDYQCLLSNNQEKVWP